MDFFAQKQCDIFFVFSGPVHAMAVPWPSRTMIDDGALLLMMRRKMIMMMI